MAQHHIIRDNTGRVTMEAISHSAYRLLGRLLALCALAGLATAFHLWLAPN